ncbi:MAG: (deoxy)nucleoside triphosphate pyrophosphohydrolase [Candidatus Margulisbacteria bacterium]|nr:(deoxy)nucleoside triphosphate pyrophosphohydrolase [Candidatus Margulisiibacteriota bacterium]
MSACIAYKEERIEQLPFKSKKPKAPHYVIAVGIIWKDDHILIARRKQTSMLGGLWEFPGGKQQSQETLEETVVRETKEETDIDISVEVKYQPIQHAYTHFKITMYAFKCVYKKGIAKPKASDEIKWIPFHSIRSYPLPKANLKILDIIG